MNMFRELLDRVGLDKVLAKKVGAIYENVESGAFVISVNRGQA
jgi:hypothetical protein